MNIKYKELYNGHYNINCKYYLPDTENIKGIILGVHGFVGDKESSALYSLAQKAVTLDMGLICFDFPAHGKSPVDGNFLTIENCMKDLTFMADQCRSDFPDAKKMLFATSFGGFIALLCSEQLSDFEIVLRSPAVTMPQIFPNLIDSSIMDYRKTGFTVCGFERKIRLPFSFYKELQHYDVFCQNYDGRRILMIHGDADTVVPHADILRFYDKHPEIHLSVIHGADHRYKKPGEIDRVVNTALNFWNVKDNPKKIELLTAGHPLWKQTIRFAETCSWKAGPLLAELMKKNQFDHNERVIVAVHNDKVIAFCTFTNKDELPPQYPMTPFIGFMYVAELYRGHHLSGKLIDAACELARMQNFSQIYLMSGEIGLYEQYGFVKLGDYETIYHTRDQLFCKELSSFIESDR